MSIIRQLRFFAVASVLLPACGPMDAQSYPGGTSELYPSNSCPDTTPTVSTSELFAADINVSPALAITSKSLFWIDRGSSISDTIQSAPLSGGDATTIFTASPIASAAIEDVVTDGTLLYFIQVNETDEGYSSTIWSLPVGGGTATLLATDASDDLTLAVADGWVYFSDGSNLQRVKTKGGHVESIGQVAGALTASGNSVFWTGASGGLLTLASPSGDQTTLVSDQYLDSNAFLPAMTANDSEVFWGCSDAKGSLLCGASSTTPEGQTLILTAADSAPYQLVADGSNVYFIDSTDCTSSLKKVGTKGGTPETLATGFTYNVELSTAHAMAVDDTYVYWTVPGQVFRVARNEGQLEK